MRCSFQTVGPFQPEVKQFGQFYTSFNVSTMSASSARSAKISRPELKPAAEMSAIFLSGVNQFREIALPDLQFVAKGIEILITLG